MSDVYKTIAAIQGELAKTGIAKSRQNTQQGYAFRGIDDVYAALAPLLSKHGLCVLPRIIDRQMHERVSIKEYNGNKRESVLFYVSVDAEFDFVAVSDGSKHTVRTFGEAMDSGDKATSKAMSAAYKYAAFMTFAIPTEGDNDADSTTHELVKSDAPPVGDEPAAREKLKGKHSSKTALQNAIKGMIGKVAAAQTTRELDAIELDFAEDLKQCEYYLPRWWNGDPDRDFAGVKVTLANRRALLGLIDTMAASETKAQMSAFMQSAGDTIDGLSDADRREFESAWSAHESAIEQMDRVAA